MKNVKGKVLQRIIGNIVEKEDPYGILLVGSLSRMKVLEVEKARDIDLFIITKGEDFQRQVENIEGLEFDISYLPIGLLKKSIEERLSSIICVLSKSKILYKSKNNTLNSSLKMIESIYEEGPQKLTIKDIDYQRFKLTQSYLTLKSRRKDRLNFNFLKGAFISELVTCYFLLNNIWMPPNKRMLKSIEDEKLRNVLEEYLDDNNSGGLENELKTLNHLVELVLGNFGGKLDFWEKDIFPFDFL